MLVSLVARQVLGRLSPCLVSLVNKTLYLIYVMINYCNLVLKSLDCKFLEGMFKTQNGAMTKWHYD